MNGLGKRTDCNLSPQLCDVAAALADAYRGEIRPLTPAEMETATRTMYLQYPDLATDLVQLNLRDMYCIVVDGSGTLLFGTARFLLNRFFYLDRKKTRSIRWRAHV